MGLLLLSSESLWPEGDKGQRVRTRETEERACSLPILLVSPLQALLLLQVEFQDSPKRTPGT